MSINEIVVDAPGDVVFATLLDPARYPDWVVGAKRIRAVDRDWPAPGAAFHHVVAVGPLELRDRTRVLEVEEPTRLVLEAHGWPAGAARVVIELEEHGGRTLVRFEERPLRGPAAMLHSRLSDLASHLRNAVGLRRLKRSVERRSRLALIR